MRRPFARLPIHPLATWLVWGGVAMLALVVGSGIAVPMARPQVPTGRATQMQGLWRNADTTIRVVVNASEAKGTFIEVGQGARDLGFKPGEVSFVGTAEGNYLHGQQTIRYGGTCYPEGRRGPMMARLTPDGRILAIHFYNITVDPNCRDTGEYSVTETVWERAPGR